jgi:hypothetical protein
VRAPFGVAQLANRRGGRSSEASRFEEARVRPEGERMFQLLISLVAAIVPICVEHRPISATHSARQGGDPLCSRLP